MKMTKDSKMWEKPTQIKQNPLVSLNHKFSSLTLICTHPSNHGKGH